MMAHGRALLAVVVLVVVAQVSCRTGLGSDIANDFRMAPRSADPGDKTLYFTQLVDHFDPLNQQTYQQKYIVNADNWVPGGPIFFFLGGEAPVEFFGFQEVYPRLLTKTFGAMYIALEHRFYGVSNPAPDYSTRNLRFLSSRQALADAANFLVSYNATLKSPGPWIVWGCSYSGALSGWFRAKYPNLVIGSIAPSGPTYAVNNFTSYFAQFSKSAPANCVSAVQQGSNRITSMLQSAQGRRDLQRIFNTCDPVSDNAEQNYYFLYTLVETLGSSDQFQNPPAWPLNQTCQIMLSSTDYVANWATYMNQQQGLARRYNEDGTLACTDYNEMRTWINPMRNVSNSNRSWYFQKCTEFGFFKPTYPGTSVFPTLGLEHRLAWCEQIFGIKGMLPNIEATNSYYGGYNLQGTNILFTNGLYDPWHNLSINESSPPPGVQASTYLAAHCAPMTAITAQDPSSLTATRAKVKDFITQLLKQNQ